MNDIGTIRLQLTKRGFWVTDMLNTANAGEINYSQIPAWVVTGLNSNTIRLHPDYLEVETMRGILRGEWGDLVVQDVGTQIGICPGANVSGTYLLTI